MFLLCIIRAFVAKFSTKVQQHLQIAIGKKVYLDKINIYMCLFNIFNTRFWLFESRMRVFLYF